MTTIEFIQRNENCTKTLINRASFYALFTIRFPIIFCSLAALLLWPQCSCIRIGKSKSLSVTEIPTHYTVHTLIERFLQIIYFHGYGSISACWYLRKGKRNKRRAKFQVKFVPFTCGDIIKIKKNKLSQNTYHWTAECHMFS